MCPSQSKPIEVQFDGGRDVPLERERQLQPVVSQEESRRRKSVQRVGALDLTQLEDEHKRHLESGAPTGEGSSSGTSPACQILLLGTSDCGKSTLRRQLANLWGAGRDAHVRALHVGVVRGHLLTLLADLMAGMRQLGIPYALPETEAAMAELLKDRARVNDPAVWRDVADGYAAAVSDAGVREALQRAEELQLAEHVGYFVEHARRILAPGYLPTDQDLLRLSVRTTGVAAEAIEVFGTACTVRDVGGMRPERRKWPALASAGVHAVFYVASLSEFSQASSPRPPPRTPAHPPARPPAANAPTPWLGPHVRARPSELRGLVGACQELREAASTNRLGESLRVLREAAAMPPLRRVPFFLFLTKQDCLAVQLSARHAELWPRLIAQLGEGAAPPQEEAGPAAAAAALIKERFRRECARCAQLHTLDATSEDEARSALEEALMLVITEHAERQRRTV